MLTFHLITGLHLILPPALVGYNADPKLKDDWQKTFKCLVATCPTSVTNLNLDALITDFDHLIQSTCKAILKP
jgi:hypothetical protein